MLIRSQCTFTGCLGVALQDTKESSEDESDEEEEAAQVGRAFCDSSICILHVIAPTEGQ